jgi:hypothetical protein
LTPEYLMYWAVSSNYFLLGLASKLEWMPLIKESAGILYLRPGVAIDPTDHVVFWALLLIARSISACLAHRRLSNLAVSSMRSSNAMVVVTRDSSEIVQCSLQPCGGCCQFEIIATTVAYHASFCPYWKPDWSTMHISKTTLPCTNCQTWLVESLDYCRRCITNWDDLWHFFFEQDLWRWNLAKRETAFPLRLVLRERSRVVIRDGCVTVIIPPPRNFNLPGVTETVWMLQLPGIDRS